MTFGEWKLSLGFVASLWFSRAEMDSPATKVRPCRVSKTGHRSRGWGAGSYAFASLRAAGTLLSTEATQRLLDKSRRWRRLRRRPTAGCA